MLLNVGSLPLPHPATTSIGRASNLNEMADAIRRFEFLPENHASLHGIIIFGRSSARVGVSGKSIRKPR
jgi:hypothetical protein